MIPVKILGFTAYDLWTFLARREANLLVVSNSSSFIFGPEGHLLGALGTLTRLMNVELDASGTTLCTAQRKYFRFKPGSH